MGKLMLRKFAVAIFVAIVLPFSVVGLLAVMVEGLQFTDGTLVSYPLLLKAEGMPATLVAIGMLGFCASFVSAELVPARRRRQRSSGTVVESDVEDGRERGIVKWFNVKKGFGFITWDEGEDVFVHFRSIRGQGHRSLSEGQRVKFTVVRGDKGPQAEDVSAIR
ncbi:cold-shock protein [Thalassolituus sp.]|uniref:cold-shock protein n=1 Tax=Thalassolituus sp. TaxID=2030822 RepID=UPI003515120B